MRRNVGGVERLDGLASGFTERGYRRCFYLELHCSDHGDIRVAAEAEPAQQHRCPLCGSSCDSVGLGRGLTLRELPSFEMVCTPTKYTRGRKLRRQKPRGAIENL